MSVLKCGGKNWNWNLIPYKCILGHLKFPIENSIVFSIIDRNWCISEFDFPSRLWNRLYFASYGWISIQNKHLNVRTICFFVRISLKWGVCSQWFISHQAITNEFIVLVKNRQQAALTMHAHTWALISFGRHLFFLLAFSLLNRHSIVASTQ